MANGSRHVYGTILQVNTTAKDLGIICSAMKNHIACIVGQGKIVLGESRLARIKCSLITKSIWAMANGSRHVYNWAASKVQVSIEKKLFMLVLSLEFTSFVSRVRLKVSIKGQFQTFTKLVIIYGSIKAVVSVPLLCQA